MTFHEIELQWIQALQKVLRNPILDSFFLGWNYVDSLFFSMILITMFWFYIDRRIGIRLLYIFVLSSIVNGVLKECFQLPRPCQIDPLVGLLAFRSPGFPSGAAQTAAIVAGVVWIESNRKLYQYLGFIFALFLCFSRIYLGAHFFSDILGGILVGSSLLIIYYYVFPWIEKKRKSRLIVFSFLLALACGSKFLVQTGVALGVATGLLFEKGEHVVEIPWYYRALEGIGGYVGFFLCLEAKSLCPEWRFFFALAAGICLSCCSLFFHIRFPAALSSETEGRV